MRQQAEQIRSSGQARAASRQLLAQLRQAEDAAETAAQVRASSSLVFPLGLKLACNSLSGLSLLGSNTFPNCSASCQVAL